MAVEFTSLKKNFRIRQKSKIAAWLNVVCYIENKEIENLNFIFCSDSYLLSINKKYLKHNFLTDIITFDYSAKSILSADIFISVDRVKENAKTFSSSFENELRRVIAHGVLHCCGYKDATEAEKKRMRKKENSALHIWEEQ